MKLRNKKTGGIDDFRIEASGLEWTGYTSLKEFCEDYEDYEEPIQVYIEGIQNVFMSGGRVYIDYATAKEAELAVRKLKAWKRLKDKGFRFVLSATTMDRIDIVRECFDSIEQAAEARDDIITLFGGEE